VQEVSGTGKMKIKIFPDLFVFGSEETKLVLSLKGQKEHICISLAHCARCISVPSTDNALASIRKWFSVKNYFTNNFFQIF
jgi:hypothetical protein